MQSTHAENGVNVEALLAARETLATVPEAARFNWRANCQWVSGTHARSVVSGFSGLGEEQHHKTTFTFDTDHPEVFASEDNGPTPVEFVLIGLAGCLTAGVAAVAQNRDVQLHKVSATVTGSMDIQGILGIDSDVRNGFDNVTVDFHIEADASDEEVHGIVAQSQKRSAVFDILTNPTNVKVNVV